MHMYDGKGSLAIQPIGQRGLSFTPAMAAADFDVKKQWVCNEATDCAPLLSPNGFMQVSKDT